MHMRRGIFLLLTAAKFVEAKLFAVRPSYAR
ncbi:MAG: hypothetical protein JWN15_621 [Firmicutes bacterium]|nr:hypothetical protein [Bacillota bacterium]